MATEHDHEQPDEPDMRGPAVICEGSVIGGFTFTGPFDTIEAACQYHDNQTISGMLHLRAATIVLLQEPKPAATIDRPTD